MDVDFPVRNAVDATEPIREIPRRGVEISIGAVEIGEVFRNRRDIEFALEQVDLVQEENDRLALEPFTIHQGLE